MSLAERRKAQGFTQESFAEAMAVDRRTVGRWETGKGEPQPPQRPKMAALLRMDLEDLDALLNAAGTPEEAEGPSPSTRHSPGDADEMIRREFLRLMTVSGTLAATPASTPDALSEAGSHGSTDGFDLMNGHLWQVYQLARTKQSVYPVVRTQLSTLNETLSEGGIPFSSFCVAAADLYQLAGELAFDANRYGEAAASYALAATASREAKSFDLWACALIRIAYVDLSEKRYVRAAETLGVARRIALQGDRNLSTRYWAASVQAEAYAWLRDIDACKEAIDEAQKVAGLRGQASNGGWLRFDGSRLAEERGARYLQLDQLDLAEEALLTALAQKPLVSGASFRRRGAALTDLAVIGARRKDPEQVVQYGHEALLLARASNSGYIAHRLQNLTAELITFGRDRRITELKAEIGTLTV
ncbi:helix-turn-helix transcriptional regulator [Streptomyces roseirectus]|uniref:Helix-turn-helix transcriptional regulator n=1 Tax=Streptomyces roseirectus TaxID=2768066 RepID=A0A7H0IGC9_9ACTN|nr:helix-turn-helix transcriptional regulator [Streptomyces roseirectus]QNP71845.1 helix-turn-helix transcriptional regulator [Streptomyces roseirectus]